MNMGFEGRVALVAAGSKGIGLSVAQALDAAGATVSLFSRSAANLEAALATLSDRAIAIAGDISAPDDLSNWVTKTLKQFGRIDLLFTNTGGPPTGFPSELTDDQWEAGVQSTLMPPIRLARLVAPIMKTASYGRIVHLTSVVAREPDLILTISSTLRAGIIALTKLQGQELAPFGITVNAILPGHTLTERQIHLAEVRSEREKTSIQDALDFQAQKIPRKALGNPDEIAAAALFLLSEASSFVNGQSLLVDGGSARGL